MSDVMKLAMERRSRVMSEIERLKEEVNRLNQFIRMGESLISQSNRGVASVPSQNRTEAEEPSQTQPTGPGPFGGGQAATPS